MGTRTGHAVARRPAVQTWPVRQPHARETRRSVIPDDGCTFVVLDYDQLELRVLAFLAGEQTLLAAFQDGVDIHARSAGLLFGQPAAELTAEQRQVGKLVNYGAVYGIGPHGLARQTGVSLSAADTFLTRFHRAHPALGTYAAAMRRDALARGYAQDLFGRRRQLPLLTSERAASRRVALRSAAHSPVAMTAAALLKVALVRAAPALEALGARPVLINRDEVLLQAPAAHQHEVTRLMRQAMLDAPGLPVPLQVHVGAGPNWLDAKAQSE